MKQPINTSRRVFTLSAAALAASVGLSRIASAQATGKPFKIGSLNSMTGLGGVYGSRMLEAIQLGVAEVNAAGGAAGRPFQIFAEDDQTRPDTAVLAVKKLIEVNKVEAVVGVWGSSAALAILPITNGADVILFSCGGAPELQTEDKRDLAWQFQSSNEIFGRAFAEIARRRGFKRPAVMAFNNSAFVGQANNFKRSWEEGGGKVSAMVIYEPNQTTYRTEVSRVLDTKPDVISLSAYMPDATIILKEWYQFGQDCKFIMPGWTANEELVKILGPEITEGLISVTQSAAVSGPAYKRLVSSFKSATGKDIDMYVSQCYDMVITLALAIEAAGPNASTLEINRKIRTVTNSPGTKVTSFAEGRDLLRKGIKIDYDGPSSELDFGKFGESYPAFGVMEINKGKLVPKEIIPGKI